MPPSRTQRRRTVVACSNCRKRKLKVCSRLVNFHMCSQWSIVQCEPPDETFTAACTRCKRRGLECEYMSVPNPDSLTGGRGTVPRLPHTAPAPFNQPPRYYGREYPDLTIAPAHEPPPVASSSNAHRSQYSDLALSPLLSSPYGPPPPLSNVSHSMPSNSLYSPLQYDNNGGRSAYSPHPLSNAEYPMNWSHPSVSTASQVEYPEFLFLDSNSNTGCEWSPYPAGDSS
jgi:hypothetical protein